MALVVADRVQETTATTGTGTITLAGAVAGFQSFAVVGNGNTTYYCITSGTAWEVGIGTYSTTGPTLARTTILASSAAGAAITLAGTSTVFCTYPAGKAVQTDSPTITDLLLAAGTTSVPPLQFTAGTNLTSAVAGVKEFDGANFYATIDTSSGRGMVPTEQYFRLTAAGTGITATVTGTNYFGANSNIALVASAFYEIEVVAWFLKTTATTAIWNLIFNAAPTAYDVEYAMSPITGIVAPPGTATQLIGQAYNQTAATYAVTTGSLTTAVNHFARFKLWVQCSATTTSMKINVYNGAAGTITPGIGSYWKCRRLPAANVGTFVA